jgi:hypothetical protein
VEINVVGKCVDLRTRSPFGLTTHAPRGALAPGLATQFLPLTTFWAGLRVPFVFATGYPEAGSSKRS